MKIQTIICTNNDREFLECFSSYMVGQNDTDFNITFFTDLQNAERHLNSRRIDVFITDFSLAGRVILPEGVVGVCISDRTKVNVDCDGCAWHELNIYQRGVDILGDIQKIISAAAFNGRQEEGGRKQKIISFSSVQGGSGKTTTAYLVAKLCAGSGKTSLYLNMEDFGYTKHLYRTDFDVSMEDVMFALKDKRDVAACVSNAIKKNADNVAVMPLVENYADFRSLLDENVTELIKVISRVSDAEYICIDLMNGFGKLNEEIMELCDYNFMVFNDDVTGNGKFERLKNDQSMINAPYYKKLYFILNKSINKEDDGYSIRIPFSESLSRGIGLEEVLAGNQDFLRSLMGIVSLIER